MGWIIRFSLIFSIASTHTEKPSDKRLYVYILRITSKCRIFLSIQNLWIDERSRITKLFICEFHLAFTYNIKDRSRIFIVILWLQISFRVSSIYWLIYLTYWYQCHFLWFRMSKLRNSGAEYLIWYYCNYFIKIFIYNLFHN